MLVRPQQKVYIHDRTPESAAPVSSRLSWVDHARGIAIMLVVYRHVIVGMKRSGFEVSTFMYNVQEIFYNFRMPVFFVLSGIFIGGSLRKRAASKIAEDRAKTVLYPYLLWGTVMVVLQLLFSQFTNSKREWTDLFDIILQPRNIDHLWYLLALFNTSMIYLVVRKLTKNVWVHGFIAAVLYLVTTIPGMEQVSLIYDAFFYYCYFFVGICVSSYMLDTQKRERLLQAKNLLWLIPICIAGQYIWFSQWSKGPAYWKIEQRFFPLFFTINLFACYLVYVLSYALSKSERNRWLSYLGKHSLYIYIMHVFIASIIRTLLLKTHLEINSWIVLFFCWSGGLLIPILLYKGFNRVGMDWLFSLKSKPSK